MKVIALIFIVSGALVAVAMLPAIVILGAIVVAVLQQIL